MFSEMYHHKNACKDKPLRSLLRVFPLHAHPTSQQVVERLSLFYAVTITPAINFLEHLLIDTYKKNFTF